MAISGTTTNERAKRSDFKYYYESKLEYLEEWKKNFGKDLSHDEKDKKHF